jgi:hypothetical protein
MKRLLPILIAALTGCAPTTLVVHHQDPTFSEADLVVDGEARARVRFGDRISLTLPPGPHRVEVSGGPRPVVIDVALEASATLTLFPPGVSPLGAEEDERE